MKPLELRRHMGTICQLLQLEPNELEWLARHMGHNIKVHKDFYQLHHSTLELTRVSMLLMMIDNGKASSFANRSLEDITFKGKCLAKLLMENKILLNVYYILITYTFYKALLISVEYRVIHTHALYKVSKKCNPM